MRPVFFAKNPIVLSSSQKQILARIDNLEQLVQREIDKINLRYYVCLYPVRLPLASVQGTPKFTSEEQIQRKHFFHMQGKILELKNQLFGYSPSTDLGTSSIWDDAAEEKLNKLKEDFFKIAPQDHAENSAAKLRQ